ncbi:MAG: hypothetical protein ABW094_12325 [Candidatus Thiodiazotropha sp.]
MEIQERLKELRDQLCHADNVHENTTYEDRKEFLELRSKLRTDNLIAVFEGCILPLITKKDPHVRVELNTSVLYGACKSYFYDVDREKPFHSITTTNDPKIAAYLIKWISRYRPIYFDDESVTNDEVKNLLTYINEYYAIRAALFYVSIDFEDIPKEILRILVYSLLYRNFSGKTLSLFIETVYAMKGIKY